MFVPILTSVPCDLPSVPLGFSASLLSLRRPLRLLSPLPTAVHRALEPRSLHEAANARRCRHNRGEVWTREVRRRSTDGRAIANGHRDHEARHADEATCKLFKNADEVASELYFQPLSCSSHVQPSAPRSRVPSLHWASIASRVLDGSFRHFKVLKSDVNRVCTCRPSTLSCVRTWCTRCRMARVRSIATAA